MTHTLLREIREEVLERSERVLYEIQQETGSIELWHEGVKVDDVSSWTGVQYALDNAPEVVERFRIKPDSSLHVRVRHTVAQGLRAGTRLRGAVGDLYSDTVGTDYTIELAHVWDSHQGNLVAGDEIRLPFRKSIFLGFVGPDPVIDPAQPGIHCRQIEYPPTHLLWDGWRFGAVADEAIHVVRLAGRPDHLRREHENFDGWCQIDLTGTWGVSPPNGTTLEEAMAVMVEHEVEPSVRYARDSWPKWYTKPGALYVGSPATLMQWG